MAMTVGRTWPGRPRPRPDEIFSSWFVRIAAANGLTAAELYRLVVPKGFARFHSDLDRVVGANLVEALSAGTGVEHWLARYPSSLPQRLLMYSLGAAGSV